MRGETSSKPNEVHCLHPKHFRLQENIPLLHSHSMLFCSLTLAKQRSHKDLPTVQSSHSAQFYTIRRITFFFAEKCQGLNQSTTQLNAQIHCFSIESTILTFRYSLNRGTIKMKNCHELRGYFVQVLFHSIYRKCTLCDTYIVI